MNKKKTKPEPKAKRTKKTVSPEIAESKPKRTNQPVPPEITEARERRAYELRIVHGMKYDLITQELNKEFPAYPLKSDHEGVRKMVQRVQEMYATRDKEKTDAVLAEATAHIDWVQQQAVNIYNKDHDDPTLLKRILEASELKAKLYGVVAPKKHELFGKNGAPLIPTPPPLDLSKLGLSDEQLAILEQASQILEDATRRAAESAVSSGDSG